MFFTLSKIKSVVISLFLMISVFFVSACSYSDKVPTDEEGGTSFIAGIDGFKINYRPDLFEVSDFYYNFSAEILSTLSTVFGNANLDEFRSETLIVEGINVIPYIHNEYVEYRESLLPEDDFDSYKDFEDARRVYFIDDIRNSVFISEQTEEDAELEDYLYFAKSNMEDNFWNWTLEKESEPYPNANLFFGIVRTRETTAEGALDDIVRINTINQRKSFYNEQFTERFAQALQVAILEILLEKEPTEFSFNFTTNQVMPNPSDLLGDGSTSGLKLEYKKYVEYVGISAQAIEEITNYLLDSVIGESKYNSEANNFDRADYKFLIEELIWNGALEQYYFSDEAQEIINNQDLGSIYNVYPAVLVQDFPTYSLFVQSQDSLAFSHIPTGQYRSVVIMPSKTDYLYTLMFYLAANREMNVNLHYRYYDAETDTLFESPVGTVKTYVESKFSYTTSDYVGLLFKDEEGNDSLYKMTKFNNNIGNGILKAETPKKMNFELNQYYEESSKGGFGLNHLKFKEDGSSFFEILFNTNTTARELDHNFKVGIQGVWARDPAEFYQ